MRVNKLKLLNILKIVGICLLLASMVVIAVRLGKIDKTRELRSTSWSIGRIDDTTGKVDSTDKSGLFTNTFLKVEELKVEVKENAKVTVQINFYTEDKTFIEDATDLTSIPATAKYARIEIVPTEDNDGKVSIFERLGYIKQVTVTYTK